MSATSARPSASVTNTITVENAGSSQSQTLVLRLNRRKKKVTWKEGTVDNEFMQKKSSKKCCIFHKEKPFDEDTSDEEDHHHHHHHSHDHDHNPKDASGSSTTG
ncbi:protein phosphatase 1 regulatory subunit INH3-like [Mangifera indica]|uniref:protein phosphatase 1 regulatory subunit INH3-like n=1 Tax=Mangifera indica TaxID=29780 RepID=UPI001CF9DE6C|nr:protein phosphatase 1 regulatory subunit INH3-like [Mangifera indica]